MTWKRNVLGIMSMFYPFSLRGNNIPENMLCLTFDDGPGEHTIHISQYLRDEGIRAAFFVIGEFAEGRSHDIAEVLRDGHLVGNHTQNHHDLKDGAAEAALDQIMKAHHVIEPLVNTQRTIFFRAPYGKWKSELCDCLNGHVLSNGQRLGDIYCGPIGWNFTGEDWHYWKCADGASDTNALREAIKCHENAERGIITLHDNSYDDDIRPKNQTYRMIQHLVPFWKARGCEFRGLDEIYANGWLSQA